MKKGTSDDGTAASSTAHEGDEQAGSSKSYQTPIVVRDPNWRSGKLRPHDASMVDVHLPSRLTKFPKGEWFTLITAIHVSVLEVCLNLCSLPC